jgi:hypothetical protein
MDDVELRERLARERQAGLLFVGTALVLAIAAGAMQIAGWGGGRLDNRIEPLFWAGAILTALGTALFGLAAVPWTGAAGSRDAHIGGSRASDAAESGISRSRVGTGGLRAGMVLFLLGPVLAVTAVFVDYWI